MIDGYAYALVIDGREIKPWITGEDGALREVNLERFVRNWEAERGGTVRVAHVIDQRINRVMMHYPKPEVFFA